MKYLNFKENARRKFFVHFGEKKMWIQRFVWIKFSLFVHQSFVYKTFWIKGTSISFYVKHNLLEYLCQFEWY